jgi:predicted O-methyltransferase YrrM
MARWWPLVGSDRRLVRQAFQVGMTQKEKEILELLAEVRRLRPRHLLEIGSSAGGTLFLWTRAAAEDATVVSIDLPAGGVRDPEEADRLRRFEGFRRGRQQLYLLRADSHADVTRRRLAKLLEGRALDFLFIDGDHSYDGIRRDFADYAPLVRPRGLIALHDIHPHPQGWGGEVPRFWTEIRDRYAGSELLESPGQDGFGIGLIRMPA